jgi:hypothetical protein
MKILEKARMDNLKINSYVFFKYQVAVGHELNTMTF